MQCQWIAQGIRTRKLVHFACRELTATALQESRELERGHGIAFLA